MKKSPELFCSGDFDLQFHFFAVLADLFPQTVMQTVALAKEHITIFIADDIAAIRDGKEGMAHAVGIGDILKQTQPIQVIVLHLLVMGQNVDICHPKNRIK